MYQPEKKKKINIICKFSLNLSIKSIEREQKVIGEQFSILRFRMGSYCMHHMSCNGETQHGYDDGAGYDCYTGRCNGVEVNAA